MKAARAKTSAERKLADILFIVWGILCIAGGIWLIAFAREQQLWAVVKERLGARSATYTRLAAAAGVACALAWLMVILLGIGGCLNLFKVQAGRKMERVSLYALSIFFLLAAAGIELIGARLIYQLIPQRAVTDFDRTSVDLLLHGVAASLLLMGLSKCLLALSFAKKQGKKRRPLLLTVSSLAAACLVLFSLAIYYRFSKYGYLFSSVFSRALKMQLNAEMLTCFCDAMFALGCGYILLAMNGSRGKNRDGSAWRAVGSLCLFFTAFCALKSFVDILCRYSLYSKFISTFTLIRHPVTSLCLIALAFALLLRSRRLTAVMSVLLFAAELYAQINSRTPIVLSSFSAAFETALPLVSMAFWALLTVAALITQKQRILVRGVAALCLLLALAPAALAVIYYAQNMPSMSARTEEYFLIETLLTGYLIPALGRAAPALRFFME